MHSRRTQIILPGAVLLIAMAAVAAWTRREPSPPPASLVPGRTNLVASRVLRRTVPEVQQAFQAFRVKQGVATPLPPLSPDGNLQLPIIDCTPPARKSWLPAKFRPWLKKLGLGPPPPANVWMGSVEARSEAPGRTRLSIYQNYVSPTNATATGQAYLDAIVAELKK